MAIPIIRERWHADMEEGEARILMEDCLRVMFYRDCRASSRIQIAKVTDCYLFSVSRHNPHRTHFLFLLNSSQFFLPFNKATAEGTLVSEPYELQTDWETANFDVRHANRAADGSSW